MHNPQYFVKICRNDFWRRRGGGNVPQAVFLLNLLAVCYNCYFVHLASGLFIFKAFSCVWIHYFGKLQWSSSIWTCIALWKLLELLYFRNCPYKHYFGFPPLHGFQGWKVSLCSYLSTEVTRFAVVLTVLSGLYCWLLWHKIPILVPVDELLYFL